MPRLSPTVRAARAAAQAAASSAAPASTAISRVAPTSLPGRETYTDDVKEPALSDIKLPDLGKGLPERGDTQVVTADSHIDKDYLDALAFMEEPVTIRIEPPQSDNAAMTVDCWVNGKGAEVKDVRTGKWLELNILPVGVVCTTKRKYVEVLARSKTMRVRTPDHGDGKNIDNNNLTRAHARSHVFSVIKDTDKGTAWLTDLLSQAF